jgi:S1-C subfamily serine protease
MVRVVVDSAKAGGTAVRRPWLGARLQAVSPEIAESLGLARPTGVLVQTVAPDSPAAKAGVKVGDLILTVDGQVVDDPQSLNYRFATRPMGGKSVFRINRQGKESEIAVSVEAAPETVAREELVLRGRTPFAGAKVVNVSPAVAEELRIADGEGVVVAEVSESSPADAAGFRPGDVIIEVNGTRINRTKDLEQATRTPQRSWRVTVSRGGRTITAMLPG